MEAELDPAELVASVLLPSELYAYGQERSGYIDTEAPDCKKFGNTIVGQKKKWGRGGEKIRCGEIEDSCWLLQSVV